MHGARLANATGMTLAEPGRGLTSAPLMNEASAPPAGPSRLRRFLLALSSPWTSLALLTVVFIHQAVGSALFPVRQLFEVNEMEWFNHWPSFALWLLICVCLVTASVLRVPRTWRHAGAHITHLGVVLLVFTCALYFGGKVEGEAILVRAYVGVETDQGAARLLPSPGASAELGDGSAKVTAIMPRWTILSPDGKSQQAWAAMVEVTLPGAEPFTATLIEGRPELTQFTLEGRRPASWLAEVGTVTAADGRVQALGPDGKPLIAAEAKAGAKVTEGERALEITGVTPDFPLLADGFQGRNGTMVAWTLKTPGGQQSGSSIVGEPALTRFQRARLKQAPDARLKRVALEPAPWHLGYHKDRPALWVRRSDAAALSDPLKPMRGMSASDVVALPIHGLPRYHDHGRHVAGQPRPPWWRRVFGGEGGSETPLDLPIGAVNGTSFTVTGYAPYASLVSEWQEDAAAPFNPLLDLRFVSDADGAQSMDRVVGLATDASVLEDTPLCWVHVPEQAAYDAAVARLRAQFPAGEKVTEDAHLAGRARIAFLNGPERGIVLWVGLPGRELQSFPIAPGQEVKVPFFSDTVRITLRQVLQKPRKVSRPVPVPKELRQRASSVGDTQSWIEVAARSADGQVVSTWVPYTLYPHLPRSLASGDGSLSMYAPRPVTITVPGAGSFELQYGKEPLPLPGDLWMTGFDVPRRPGSDDPSEFFCTVAYADAGSATPLGSATIHMNHPLEWRDTFFFQASWDPETQALTVLGVGNRPAGWAMLAASLIIALGMAWSGAAAALRRNP